MRKTTKKLITEPVKVYMWDTRGDEPGNFDCERCQGTGTFRRGRIAGDCFRCAGKGYHTQEDRRRNAAFDRHEIRRNA